MIKVRVLNVTCSLRPLDVFFIESTYWGHSTPCEGLYSIINCGTAGSDETGNSNPVLTLDVVILNNQTNSDIYWMLTPDQAMF